MLASSLSYELSILAKAVQHKNLSAAAVHVGLSQPQLSRLIHKLESELQIVLLDRSARRKSGWTQTAHELALLFSRGIARLDNELMALAQQREPTAIHIGSLEGLSGIASDFAQFCFQSLGVTTIYIDVFDFQDLDSQFLAGDLDMIFTVRPPSRQKYSHVIEVGFQQSEKFSSDKNILVCSPYEYMGVDKKSSELPSKALVSNSLALRSHWLHTLGGTGLLPTDAKTGKGKGAFVIYLIASELFSPRRWQKVQTYFSAQQL